MKYTVDTGELADWVDDLKSFDDRCEQLLCEVDALVAGLQLHWEGDAANAAHDNHERWGRDLKAMREAVTEITARATGAHRNYRTAVATNQRMWNL